MNKSAGVRFLNIVLTFFVCIATTGCGATEEGQSGIAIDKEGAVTSVIYDDFGEEYYELSELTDMAAQEISYYNSEYDAPRIELTDAQTSEEGIVRLAMEFSNSTDYSHFNQVTLFYGTLAEAEENGYKLSGDLIDSDGVKLSSVELDGLRDRHIIISSEKIRINTPYNIAYTTRGVLITDKKEADLSYVSEDAAWLLLSK